jgi:ABC-2 type transport system ATP-binding protein
MNILEAHGLGKRYRQSWALRNCTLAIPAGRIVALVGPNGAGKTTLLHLAVGLDTPTAGGITVVGTTPGSPAALSQIAFVAQDAPLYQGLSAACMLDLAASLNHHFDRRRAEARLGVLGIPLGRKISRLSGGQRAQLALSIALARRPRLLVLDEPHARLDPLARHDFMASLMTAAAEEGLSVLLSSHIIGELERVADYLVVLSSGRVQLMGDIAELLAHHVILTGPAAEAGLPGSDFTVVQALRASRQAQLLVRTAGPPAPAPAGWEAAEVTLEELVLAYLREPSASMLPGPTRLSPILAEGPAA